MNIPPSEGNEGIVDIFVLSGSSAETRLLEENLEQDGYRVSRYDESAQLLESLNEGNPNLLICDATSLGQAGYDTCRQIKAGETTWMIPVLVLTRTTGLSDLLAILDCNADNFITYPCDPGYFLSFIEGMLSTPVERQTADLIKTQFKIQHDDKVYVVTADRRKLLEFLLSSFETAVTISADLSQAQEEARQLSDSFAKIRLTSAEQARSIITLNESLRQKEKAEAALSDSISSQRKELEERESEIARLESELEDRGVRLATAEEQIRGMEQEHATVSEGHRANIDSLSRQVSELSAELQTKISDLETTQHNLEKQAARCANAECTIAELAPQKEEAEKALLALRFESDKIQEMLASEKDRVLAAGEELVALRQSKEKAEEEMALAISGLRDEVALRDGELARISGKLEEETIRADHTEERLSGLQHEKEESENSLRDAIEALRNELQQLETRHEAVTAQLEEEDLRRKSIEEELELANAEREKSDERVREVNESLKEAESALAEQEQRGTSLDRDLKAITAEHNRLEADLQLATEAISEARTLADEERQKRVCAEAGLSETVDEKNRQEEKIRELSSELDEARATLEKEIQSIQAEFAEARSALVTTEEQKRVLEREIADLTTKHERSEDSVRTASQALDEARSSSEDERRRRESAEAGLAAETAEKERIEQEIQSVRAEVAEARSARTIAEEQKETLERELAAAKQEQESAGSDRQAAVQALAEARSALDLERGRIQALERQLVIVIREKEEGVETVRLATEDARRNLEMKTAELADARQEIERVSAKLSAIEEEHRSTGILKEEEAKKAAVMEEELEKVRAMLASEQQLRATAEMSLKSVSQEHERLGSDLRKSSDTWRQRENEHAATIQRLSSDLKAVLAREETLVQQVNQIAGEKSLAEQKLDALALELQQARSALADEWEDHMTADEQLAAASESSEQLQNAEKRLNDLTDELQQARSALADEWEDHMNAAERLEEADKKNEQLQQSMAPSVDEQPVLVPRESMVVKEPALPITIKPRSFALAKTDFPDVHVVHSESPAPRHQTVPDMPEENTRPAHDEKRSAFADLRIEDLFEDEPGEVYSGPAPEHPAEDTGKPEPGVAEAETDAELSEKTGIIPAKEATPEESAIPDELETESEEEQESGEHIDADTAENNHPAFVIPPGGLSFNRQQWFDLFTWARHAESLSSDQRMQIIRMGRLIQRGRKLTKKQDEQIRELIALVQAHGYQFS